MLRSTWVVETHVYDYFDYDGRYSHRQKTFSSLVEAYAYYKEEKAYDVEWDDHSQKTKISHVFVYENEDKIRQEERKRRQEKLLLALKEAFLKSLEPDEWPKDIENPPEPTYLFDEDDVIF